MSDEKSAPTPRQALYFGFRSNGHYLYDSRGNSPRDDSRATPWSLANMDTGLLKNGKKPDTYDGRVFWTAAHPLWLAFIWWDRSGDSRSNSNSGFYVQGFEHTDRQAAFDYACSVFPDVVKRQHHPLVLQP